MRIFNRGLNLDERIEFGKYLKETNLMEVDDMIVSALQKLIVSYLHREYEKKISFVHSSIIAKEIYEGKIVSWYEVEDRLDSLRD